jgi:hypothetical protein
MDSSSVTGLDGWHETFFQLTKVSVDNDEELRHNGARMEGALVRATLSLLLACAVFAQAPAAYRSKHLRYRRKAAGFEDDKSKAALDVIVIDHIDKGPVDN